MEQKSWRWRKKGSEKTIVDNGRASLCLERDLHEDEERVEHRKCASNVSEGSGLFICDCNAKENLIRKQARIAEKALAGQKMAETEAAYFKQELDKVLLQGEVAEQKLANLNVALEGCMLEIEALRVAQKMTVDFEKETKKLEGKLAESNKRVSNLSAENANLMKALFCKEKLVQDLDKGKADLEAEIGLLIDRIDSAEKENTFLKYEFQVMEKDMKNSQRSELENAKQIRKLEAECQQLRNLIRKRLQVPTAPLKGSNPKMGPIEKVYNMEEENKMLKEILALSDAELQTWRMKYGQMASKVAELKAQLNELSEAENSMQLAISGLGFNNHNEIRDSESWATALLGELEQFRQKKITNESETDKLAMVTSKELVPVSVNKENSWLDEILKVILEEHRATKRNLGELLQDIKIALGCNNLQSLENERSDIQGLLTWESLDSTPPENSTSSSVSMGDIKGLDMKDASFSREKIRRHLNFDRSKSEDQIELDSPNRHNTLAQMIALQSAVQEENKRVKEKLQCMTDENSSLRNQLEESTRAIGNLQREVESLKESKGLMEEQVENQRLINEDLDTHLTVAKGKLNEILHKVSSLEVELEDKSHCCEELEATCLELQLQLETSRITRKESPGNDVAKKFRTETIQQLAKQLKALPSPDITQFDDLLSPLSTAITLQKASAPDKKSLVIQRSTLRDRMKEEESSNGDSTEKQSINHSELKTLPPPPGLKVQSLEQASTLALVPSKKSGGGFGFITKLFLRRKKGNSKMKAAALQRNSSALTKQRDVLLVV
ncbi:unnamed protein product [Amaranthus hypochondriacus]